MENNNTYAQVCQTKGKIIIGNTAQKGRGIFARETLVKGELIEIAPVVIIPEQEREFIDRTVLTNYYYEWGEYGIAIGLGLISLYNHSYHPNAMYVKKFDRGVIEYLALRDIQVGEEITVNYNSGNPDDQTPIWFDTVE